MKGPFVSPDYGVHFENYLNLYHGIEDLDVTQISHLQDLSEDEKSHFEAFVQQVRAYDITGELNRDDYIVPDDMTLLRFLQADNWNADKALRRIVATLEFHAEMNLKQVMSSPPENLEAYRKIRVRAHMGRTKDGMPIFVERLGGFMNGIPSAEGKALTKDDWCHCFLYDLGELIREIRSNYAIEKETDNPVTWKATWVMDCKGISVFKAYKAMSTIKMIDNMTEPNFPEFAGPIYMINSPSLVAGIWKLAKVFLDPAVVAKIQIHSNVPKELMLERMDESVLFEEYGGTNKKEFPKSQYI